MTAPQPHYTIVVPAYNEEAHLPETLQALQRAMQGVPWRGEVVVVDNNSTDGTAAIAHACGARVVHEPVNQIARARNAGAAAANGRWLVFVDADTTISPCLLHDALRALESGTACGGGALVAFSAPIPAMAEAINRSWNWFSRTFRLAAGCFVFCKREAFEAVGGFDERVYASEEIWLSRALDRWGRRHGQRMLILSCGGVRTSPRKLRWHSQWRVAGMVALMLLFPPAVRSRRLCWFWYQRPQPIPETT